MSDEARPVSVSISAELAAEAARLVETKQAVSISAVVHDALQEYLQRDLEERGRRWWEAKAAEARANPEIVAQVARERAHVDEQLRRFEEEHRGR